MRLVEAIWLGFWGSWIIGFVSLRGVILTDLGATWPNELVEGDIAKVKLG